MRATATAPANIALIKYWGKKDAGLRLPANNSISINLSGITTVTAVEFSDGLGEDRISIDGRLVTGVEHERIVAHLDRIRKMADIRTRATVESRNNFPKGTGMASSASGFAALSLAASCAAGLSLSEKKLSILARLGSGSACRSIPSGFVEWRAGTSDSTSYAYSLFPADYWDIRDVIAIVGSDVKKISSTEGHSSVASSPLFIARIKGMPQKIKKIKEAIRNKDFSAFGEVSEAEALNMHAIMMTSRPALIYWTPTTLRVMHQIIDWRSGGLESYFTIDAGPNVHVLCLAKDALKLEQRLSGIEGVQKVIVNQPANGATLISDR
jgi:diphosphomevalonate decarboxylase